jgi:type VI secretion system secreted protein Hcp
MLTLAVAPPAQAEIFVTIKGQKQGVIRGDSVVKGHENQIVATSFDYDVKSPRDPATGLATGKRQHSPVTLRINSGAASVHLFEALVTNENLTSVVIDFVASDGLASQKRVILTNAALSDMHQRASTAKATWLDDVSLVFQKIEVLDVASGASASDSTTAAP